MKFNTALLPLIRKRGNVPQRYCGKHGGGPLTVCSAALFRWVYSDQTTGAAAIAISGRMITAGDVQYQPPQSKFGILNDRSCVLVAGDYPPHSEAILKTRRRLAADPSASVEEIAEIYGSCIRDFKKRFAAQTYLAPFGLDEKTFVENASKLPANIANELAEKLLNFDEVDCSAIVVGSDGEHCHLYLVDEDGRVSCQDDVGFISIGIGASHANSQFMSARYTNQWTYVNALAVIYAAKKRAEVAPGVGSDTDMILVTRNNMEVIIPEILNKIEEVYREHTNKEQKLAEESISKLDSELQKLRDSTVDDNQSGDSSNEEDKPTKDKT